MANVSSRGSADRAQLLLITGLALAVILVAVALLLNSAIFTENVATRDTTADGSEAIELRGELVMAVGELIETENRQGGGDTGDVEDGVTAMGPLVDRERGRHSIVATVEPNGSAVPGQLLRWDDPETPRRFDAPDSDGNWTLVESLTDTRGFSVTLTDIRAETPLDVEADAFGVRLINDSVENRTLYLYEDGNRVIVERATESSGPTQQCAITHNGANTTVDLTGDRLTTNSSAVECYRGLWHNRSVDAIEFRNGDAADGTFAVTVDDGATPRSYPGVVQDDDAVYSMLVDIAYTSADLDFSTTVRVAPGEPR